MKNLEFSQEQIAAVLDMCYNKAVSGVPGTQNCYELAEQYTSKYATPEMAAKEFIKWQVAKCTTSGFITSLGGLITLPVAIPANLATVWYVQMRMLATLAIIGGQDPMDDSVQTLAYICLTGTSISKVCRDAGIQFANKFTIGMIKKIPGATLKKINHAVLQRFITKFGSTGIINLGKMVPLVGGIVGGGFDYVGTKIIARQGYKTFLLGEIE